MNKLKTVKDIEKEFQEQYNYEDSIPSPDVLKKEAIKWVKEMDEQLKNPSFYNFNSKQEKVIGLCATLEWIKMFFNIGEEDLK